MNPQDISQRYLDALNSSDLAAVYDLFTHDAIIVSPLYGVRSAQEFYAELFSDTSRSETTLLHVFEQAGGSDTIALHFLYNWTLANGDNVSFECVDVFELSDQPGKFKKMTVIYDTAPLRSNFEASKTSS